MDNQDLETINKIDEFVTDLNKKIKYPYFFSWSMPTNHVAGQPLTYFCIYIGKYLVQDTEKTIERNEPILLTYFFGRISDLETISIPENIATWWANKFSTILKRNYMALDAIARGYKNPNYSEYDTHEYSEQSKLEEVCEGSTHDKKLQA